MDKNVEIGLLCDIYGELLTEKQQDILDLYYNNNLSLAEIAEEIGITRQAVKDSIVKGEKRLFRIRGKTWNYEKSTKTRKTDTKDII
ncbi:MAG: HTH domain-containing protein [Clostridia bacterium]|nr:HTH domain-containing protein [Clostridia bacterium]